MNSKIVDSIETNLEQKVLSICKDEFKEFFKYPNVVGVGLGNKEINGKEMDVKCIKVMVKEKVKLLSKKDTIPKFYKNIPTDVIQTGEFKACGFSGRLRPMEMGYSISNLKSPNITTGTACCLVTKGEGANIEFYILGSNHIMADNNEAAIGSEIIQPGFASGGGAGDVVAKLTAFKKIQFDDPKPEDNTMDAAIAKVTDINLVTPEIAFMLIPKSLGTVVIGELVQKSGREAGYTSGVVQQTGVTMLVRYEGALTALLKNQIATTKIGDIGDSGSPIMTTDNRLAGMFVGTSGTISAFTPISVILDYFKVNLYSQFYV